MYRELFARRMPLPSRSQANENDGDPLQRPVLHRTLLPARNLPLIDGAGWFTGNGNAATPTAALSALVDPTASQRDRVR